jgi:hypothetical protein
MATSKSISESVVWFISIRRTSMGRFPKSHATISRLLTKDGLKLEHARKMM